MYSKFLEICQSLKNSTLHNTLSSDSAAERHGFSGKTTLLYDVNKLGSVAQPSLMAARYVMRVKAHVQRLRSMELGFTLWT